MKHWLGMAGCLLCILCSAQKPKGRYSDQKKQITETYRKEMMAIGSKRLPAEEKKRQREAAMARYLSAKRANRIAYRRKVSHASNPVAVRAGAGQPK